MHFARLAVLLLAAVVAAPAAQAQTFPGKQIRLIVPFPPGGPNDIIARAVGQRMSEILKQPIVIENKSGRGGALGTDFIAKAEPDGYTIGITSAGALAISPSMERLSYDPATDLQPVTLVAKVPEMLVVTPALPVATLQQLVAYAKANPRKLNFASSGPGSLPHLAGELFKLTAGVDIVHVPYRGAAPAVNDLLGEQVQMAFFDLPVLLPHVRAGKLRPIVIAAPQRAPSAPDVPTTAEAGMPALQAENWYGMVAPARTPPEVVARLNEAAVQAMRDPHVAERLASQGAILVGDSPEQFRTFIQRETEKWARVVREAGVESSP